jgi:hypothetical protein
MDTATELAQLVERHVARRTGERVRSLHVDWTDGRLIVHGFTRSHYEKQLAFSAVHELIDSVPVELDIQVTSAPRESIAG